MQADEEVGKIAMAVPLLVCKKSCLNLSLSFLLCSISPIVSPSHAAKALELFLQDLCDRTYDITLQRGAKTVNSFHL